MLLLTTFDLDEYVLAGIEAGASGFLTKDADPRDILSAIRAVAAGDAVLAPAVTRRLIGRLVPRAERPSSPPPRSADVEHLTARERDILMAIGRGMTNTEIAEQLFLADSTVKNYVGRVFTKIGARDRVHAALFAHLAGIVRIDDLRDLA